MKRSKAKLSIDSITTMASQLKNYANLYESANDLFVTMLADVGITVADQITTQSTTAETTQHTAFVRYNTNGAVAEVTLVLEGEQIAFIEFGAGVHYNGAVGQSPNPNGDSLGMTIGSYGQGKGAQDKWVYENNGVFVITYGTEATMPMYKASLEMINNVVNIGKYCFGGIIK